MKPLGYVVLRHAVRLDRPVEAQGRWMRRIQEVYVESGLQGRELAQMKHYPNLMQLAAEAKKPVFHLKPGDGAIGAHSQAAREIGKDFDRLARTIADGAGIQIPSTDRLCTK